MATRHSHYARHHLRRFHPWYFLAATIVFGSICLISLRHNNERMVELRDAVYAADKSGGDVEGTLRDLRAYIYTHMNTSLASGPNAVHPPIQLKYTYERLQAAQQQSLGQNNSALYGQAQQYCNSQGQTTSAQETINCIQGYASVHGIQLANIPDALYKFDFISAKWSPDVAGWSLVATLISALAFLVSAAYVWLIKRYI